MKSGDKWLFLEATDLYTLIYIYMRLFIKIYTYLYLYIFSYILNSCIENFYFYKYTYL